MIVLVLQFVNCRVVTGEFRYRYGRVVSVSLRESCALLNFERLASNPEAVEHETEAIKRNSTHSKVYSDRASCFTKLGALPDAHKCRELDKEFVKGYSRKGAIHFFRKEYEC